MRVRFLTSLVVSIAALGFAMSSNALELSRYFSDNMVLQREKPVSIWGTAAQGAMVTVSFAGQKQSATADADGRWSIMLDPLEATVGGRELRLQASGADKDDVRSIVLSNVCVGDVYLFGRQTFVDISLGRTELGRAAASKYRPSGEFRAISIEMVPEKKPLDDLSERATSGWIDVDRKNAGELSGAAFYLGADLVKEAGVPIGIVDLNMNHHFGISWLSDQAIADISVIQPDDKDMDWLPTWMKEQADDRDSGKAQEDLDAYHAAQLERNANAVKPSLGLHPLDNPMYPAAGYNAVIHPLKDVVLKGILLQLGNDYPFVAYRTLDKTGTATDKVELNAAWGDNYMILKAGYRITPVTHPYVPETWRKAFGDESLPIGLILPPSSDLDVYAAHNREVRELHRRTSLTAENIGLILPGMENIPSSGQPVSDELLAERCLQWVLGDVMGKDVIATGPVVDRVEGGIGKGTVFFKPETANGLKAMGDALSMFEGAGPDGVFTPVRAKIDGETIKLTSDGPILFVRYNWTDDPEPGLVNEANLPALPFNTYADWSFAWIPPPQQDDLPEEYSLTADKWSKSDVSIINGQIANLSAGDSAPIPHRPGPIGFVGAPFGPNIYVNSIDPGTPAEGKLMPGDIIYGINGKIFNDGSDFVTDDTYHDVADAITYSESEEGEGKLVLSIRRGTKLMDVELQLQVLGSYSSSTPYYCEKSANIVKNAEAWSSEHYRPESGLPSSPRGMLNTDLLFLLASGTPAHQGLVRRAVYEMIEGMELGPVTDLTQSKPWSTGHASLILGEYFHATGDRNVLPYLKYQADLSSASQLKPRSDTPPEKEAAHSDMQVGGWRHNYPGNPERWKSGYGLLPHVGMACVMGMQLGKEAGLDIDELALERGLRHLHDGRAEYAFVLYSYNGLTREGPAVVNPEAEAKGHLWSMNGKLGMAAALFDMIDDRDTVEICSRYCVYGYNRTRSGHGGMFFNNFWTPVGAWAAGERGFKHFMKGQIWWRELFRRHDGSFNQVGRGSIGVSYALHYVAPRQRLRMLGAPRSAFGTNCPDYLKAAVDAHQQRDYERCEALILKELERALPANDMPVVNHLLESVQTLRASIDHDLTLVEKLIDEEKFYYASLELPQLKGVVAEDNARLRSIVEALESDAGRAEIAVHRKACEAMANAAKHAARAAAPKETWGAVIPQKDNTWQMKVVETIAHAPEGWTEPKFDDGGWDTAELPISWTMYHTALFRGTFAVEDRKAVEGLRVMGKFFQQQNVVIYLNGKLVAKVDEIDRGIGMTEARLNDYALKLLKDGENTIAISSRHKRRWGPYRGTYKTAATMGFWVEAMQAEIE